MEIHIKVDRPRWLRVPRRRSAKLLLVFVVALAVAAPFAWATDRFVDVPAASPHHNDINTIAAAGITAGCNPPMNSLYCPGDFVRRDQMASFLTRGLPRIAVSTTVLPGGFTLTRGAADFTHVAEVTINVPGTGNATQYVKVDAAIAVFNATECECRFHMRIVDVATGQFASGGFFQT